MVWCDTSCFSLEDVSSLTNVHALLLGGCGKVLDISAIGNTHTLDLHGYTNLEDVSTLACVHSLDLSRCWNVADVSMLGRYEQLASITSDFFVQSREKLCWGARTRARTRTGYMHKDTTRMVSRSCSVWNVLPSKGLTACRVAANQPLPRLHVLDIRWCPRLQDMHEHPALRSVGLLLHSGCTHDDARFGGHVWVGNGVLQEAMGCRCGVQHGKRSF